MFDVPTVGAGSSVSKLMKVASRTLQGYLPDKGSGLYVSLNLGAFRSTAIRPADKLSSHVQPAGQYIRTQVPLKYTQNARGIIL